MSTLPDFQQRSFWMQSLPGGALHANAAQQGDESADVVIIGGGFTGLSTAWHLKIMRPKWRVCVLESEVCGFGASGRNGGFAMTLFGLTKGLVETRFGRERAQQAHAYMEQGVDYLADLIAEQQLDCDFERSGYLLIASQNRHQQKRLQHELAIFNRWRHQHPVEFWDQNRLRQEVSTEHYHSAWFEPRCGILNPAKLARELKRLAESAGVVIYEQSPVTQIDRDLSKDFCIKTPQGQIRSEKLVFATNAYSHLLSPLRRVQAPAFTHIVMTEPLNDTQMASINWRQRCGIEDSLNLIHYYRLTKDNRIVIGGGDVTVPFGRQMDHDNNARIQHQLEQHLLMVFPQLRGIRFTHRWGGPVSITTDVAPAIGFIGDDKRALYSVGCAGHGVGLTPQNGRTLAELLTEQQTERTEAFFVGRSVLPWPPEPLRFVLGQAVRGALRLGDQLLYRRS